MKHAGATCLGVGAGWRRLSHTVLLLAAFAIAPLAQAADSERIIVTNARLIGRDAPAHDVPVNLLIVGGRLTVVTKDDLVIQPGDVAVDASGGFLFGQLALGSHPTFVILDRDPRKDFDVMLDTGENGCQVRSSVVNEFHRPPPINSSSSFSKGARL